MDVNMCPLAVYFASKLHLKKMKFYYLRPELLTTRYKYLHVKFSKEKQEFLLKEISRKFKKLA